MAYFEKLDKNNNLINTDDKTEKEVDYKRKYYALYREMCKIPNKMCDNCPIVHSCCKGCNLLKIKLKRIKSDKEWGLNQD